ncbi:MAG: DUF998 domain-containing protein [Promethearchaeota archaeon]
MSTKSKLKKIIAGKLNKNELLIYVMINYGIAALFLALAIITLTNESGFSFLVNDISHTGSSGRNPRGWYFFSIFMVCSGITSIPNVMYIYNGLKRNRFTCSKTILIFYLVALIGTTLVGLFPSDLNHLMHVLSAALAFGGFTLALLTFFLNALAKKLYRISMLSILLISVIALTIITQGRTVLYYDSDFDRFRGTIYSFSLWEWLLFFTIVVSFLFNIFILPKIRKS